MKSSRTVRERVQGTPVHTLEVEVEAGPDKGKRVASPSDVLTIGTAGGNDLVLTDETVSRYHCELKRQEDRVLVEDNGSTNGTSAGGILLSRALVPPGTVLTLGRTQVRIEDGRTVTVALHGEDSFGRVRGRSPEMRGLMARLERAARSDVSVLLLGETGTGKEVIARAIHEASPRAAKPFETVDCAALLPALVASELFGHEKGAFTGADRQHVGAFERAHGGTIFLDEIGELPPALQAGLLGVLERRRFRRLGGEREIEVDVRVLAATHRDLRADVNAGTFRQDLYYRLAVLLLRVPPLRERKQDIPLLVEHFLHEAGHDGPPEAIITRKAMDSLSAHHWPGNVRELRNLVEATLAMGELPEMEPAPHAAKDDKPGFPSIPLDELLKKSYKEARRIVTEELEQLYLTALLDRTEGNVSQASRESGLNRNYLTQLAKRHRISGRKSG